MIVRRQWSALAGRDLFNIVVGGGAAPGDRWCDDLVATAVAEVARAGFDPHYLVRSRVWARDAALRRAASDARVRGLVGPLRAASASFIAPERLAPGIDVLVDLTAMKGSGEKVVREYEPRIAPPMFVACDGLVFLSGNTDESADFDAQFAAIRAKVDASLAAAGTAHARIVAVSAFVSRALDWREVHDKIAAWSPCPIVMTTVEGYSAATKLVEIEVTATA